MFLSLLYKHTSVDAPYTYSTFHVIRPKYMKIPSYILSGKRLSGKRLVRETSVRESDCPGNVCKAFSLYLRNDARRGYKYHVLSKAVRDQSNDDISLDHE